uniref:RANBP2-like and GRIP domain-containing protein 8 n=1 Tax=Magallana gigas TaxID=29159 RepID=K1QC48_MAGGI
MRLEEQAKILKEEIRRLERNQQREKEAANMEYLKNILLKFLSLKVGDERQQLVPVLTTMLKLSPEEKTTLDAAAQGLKEKTTLPINPNNSSSKEEVGGLISTAGQDWCERQGLDGGLISNRWAGLA